MDVHIEENKATSRETLDSIWDSDSDDSLEVFAGSFEEKEREREVLLDNLIHDFSERNPQINGAKWTLSKNPWVRCSYYYY